jgi:hypothetical protein
MTRGRRFGVQKWAIASYIHKIMQYPSTSRVRPTKYRTRLLAAAAVHPCSLRVVAVVMRREAQSGQLARGESVH